MKKIISLVLVFTCLLFAVGCVTTSTTKDGVTKIKEYYTNAMPTHILVETETNFDGTKLYSEAELLTGTYKGKTASVYTHTYQKFATVDEILTSPIVSSSESKEYFEGIGLRVNFITNKRAVFASGSDFAPQVIDSVIPNLSNDYLQNVSYADGVFSATVPKDFGDEVFGERVVLASDASLVIETAGSVVTRATITYTIPAANADAPNAAVTMVVTYSYDVQQLSPLADS